MSHDGATSQSRAKPSSSMTGGGTSHARDGDRPQPVGTTYKRADPSRPQPVGAFHASDRAAPPQQQQPIIPSSELDHDEHRPPRTDRDRLAEGHGS